MEEYNDVIVPEILSTHPANETRATDLDNLIPAVSNTQIKGNRKID